MFGQQRMALTILAFALAAMSAARAEPARSAAPSGSLPEAQEIVADATRCGRQQKVESGPQAQTGKTLAIVAEDLRNGGILGAARGIREAADVIGWKVRVFDLGGRAATRDKIMKEVLEFRPHAVALLGGIVLEGSATKASSAVDLTPFTRRGIHFVGWHAGPWPGPIAGTPVATNVTTDPLLVARMAASKAIVESGGRAGVVIFTDSTIGLAMTKANAMAEAIRNCKQCEVLEMQDVRLDEAGARMTSITQDLLKRHGKRWTHALAINDIYFDYMVPALITSQVASNEVRLISGGDGSTAAFLRIAAGSFQTATAADPLNLQGWQIVDELNRLFANQPLSGFHALPHLVTAENMACDGAQRRIYDPENGYRDAYRRIWKR